MTSNFSSTRIEYAYHEGIPLAVLTDGREWNFYYPSGQGSYDERRFYKLDLVDRDINESQKRLSRYLGYDCLRDGSALDAAKEDYESASTNRVAAEAIPRAWEEIVSEPDELLIELIAERVETLSGLQPNAEDIEKFLLSIQQPGLRTVTQKPVEPVPLSPQRRPHVVSERHVAFELLGSKREAKTAKDAMIEILKTLATKKTGFWELLSQRARSRKRNHLSRQRESVYPGRPDLAASTIEIAPGWWIGVNIANREKDRIIRAACECAGVTFGRDVKIDLPNLNV